MSASPGAGDPDPAAVDGEADPLEGCAAEPIRVPGAIQPHGWLLAVREPELVVVAASDNASALLDAPLPELLGRPLPAGPGAVIADALAGLLGGSPDEDIEALNPLAVTVGGRALDAVIHRGSGLLFVELEPAEDQRSGNFGVGVGGALGWYQQLRAALHRLPRASSVSELVDELTDLVAELTGFDRVMTYRFTPEWDGEVIAERKAPGLEPFLGLRYPATDIPAQARALYTTNWLRLIPTSEYTPVPLVPSGGTDGEGPLDLSGAMLRSVSPVHLEYLRNMGVAASMSVSVVIDGRLWGLIACHHYTGPHRPPYRVRAAAEMLARTASILLAQREMADRAERRAERGSLRSRAIAAIAARREEDGTGAAGEDLLGLVDASGVTVRLGGTALAEGAALDLADADAVAAALLDDGEQRGVGATDHLAQLDPRWAGLAPEVAGALAVRVGDSPDRYVLWTRPEWQREVAWAGDPRHQKAQRSPAGLRLSPRSSFEVWVERVGLRSRPWDPADLDEALDLGRGLSDLVLRRAFEQSEVTAALQRTLLLEGLPAIRGIESAMRYLPGGDQPVGGDWFELLSLPDGLCALAIGDVAGHGLMASAVTAQLRQGLRAYLLREEGPEQALARLNDLANWVLPDDIATTLVAVLDPADGRLRWVSAGHVPPLVAAGAGSRYLGGSRGPALGVRAGARFDATADRLAPGEVLVLYSDGLIERRGESIDDGLRRLREAAAGLPAEPEALCQGLVERLAADGRPDDVTVLAVRRA
ncbi:SpoIIE family protein phosphatase [Acidiferrimicrobium sp. IK]|uniref:SpoIIE family protein phosphatase n=1 Tax=Acidiferrimicrobium sp. IK TaxID=2871700 RepID=UPI0021CAE81B|nr:SpoIIE family protein phosphatase [Acidiferrimicrobium sp. IK]MCU4185438.1 SpoIIE family protein phosphatase [Acidiferrimicrobium sp. IK]